ncbi:MAG: transporter permease [Frankiales bacterium]|nr:transporter permease [Frankiales bacterium]
MKPAWRAELLKITTVRALWLGVVLATATIPLISLAVAATGGLSHGDTVTSGAATGTVIGLLAFGTWGAVLSAGEYVHGTFHVSLMSVPRRGVLLVAKLAAGAAVASAAALVSSGVALLVVRASTPSGDHQWGNPLALLGVVAAVASVTVVGTALGILTRSSTAAILVLAAAILLPQAAAGLLGSLQPWVVGASPGAVVTQVVGGAQLSTDHTFPAGTASAVAAMIGVAALIASVAGVLLSRRDG